MRTIFDPRPEFSINPKPPVIYIGKPMPKRSFTMKTGFIVACVVITALTVLFACSAVFDSPRSGSYETPNGRVDYER